jgi:hypothetical protein
MSKWENIGLPRILVGLAAIVLFIYIGRAAWLFARYNWNVIVFPYNVDYGEGPILDQVIRLAHFQNIYRKDLATPPYTISNYPPLYLLLQVPFAWSFGPAFWYGHAISFLSMLAAGLFIILTLQVLTGDWLSAAIGGFTLFAIPYILHWSPFCRVDSLALGLSMAGLYIVTRWSDQRRGLILSAVLLSATVYTRQSYALAAPFAAFVWLLRTPPRRKAFELALWTGGICLGLFLVLNILTGGGFYFNIVTANVNQFFWNTVQDYRHAIWEHMPYLVVGSLAFILLAVWWRVKSWWLVAPYLLGATLSAITIGKDGSNVNYLFELSAAFSLVAGAIIAASGRWWWLKAGLILLLAYQVNGLYGWTYQDYYRDVTRRVTDDRVMIEQLAKAVHEANGPVLADEFMGLVVLDGRPLVFQPFEFKQLAIAGLWNQKPFLDTIEKQEYGLILLYNPPSWDSRHARWTDEQLAAISSKYISVQNYADTLIYTPYP